MHRRSEPIAFGEAVRFWLKLGFINFGGPSGQIALMHEELVERRRWIGEGRFLHALSFCMLLPGPEAQQLAIYVGWLLHKVRGGIAAGVLFIMPSFLLMLLLSWAYAAHGGVTWVAGLFAGLSASVVGMVAVAVLRIGGRALGTAFSIGIAIVSFFAIFLLGVSFPAVIAGAAGAGYLASRVRPTHNVPGELAEDEGAVIDDVAVSAAHTRPSAARTLRVLLIGLGVWWLPLLAIVAWRGTADTLAREALFFSSASVVTFGGAYAVLAFVTQAAVYRFGWLSPAAVVSGLGLAESTPGPLIMVTEFVGFLAAYRFHGNLTPLVAGLLGACITVWATFAPCFLWIFLGAPYIERLRGNQRLGAALSAITAAVVGVIASLALSFATTVLFSSVRVRRPFGAPVPVPSVDSIVWFSLAIAVASFVAIRSRKVNAVFVVLACGVLGLVRAVTG